MGLTDQMAHRPVQCHLTGGTAVDAHFVLNATAINPIARAQLALRIEHVLGDHKQADAFAAGGCIGQARQHQVNDVAHEIVVA